MSKNTEHKIKYFAYVRKSSENKERQALSIGAQKEKVRDMFPDLDIEFVEEEKSAFKPYIRTLFAKTLERIDKGERGGLIAYSPDRLSRNEVDASTITYRVRMGAIKDLRFATSHFENSPEGIWSLQMALSQSQYESAKKGRDVKRGLNAKAKLGWRPSGAPVGYLNTPDKAKGFKTIECDPDRFAQVRSLWDLMLTGNYTVPQVLKESRKMGLTTPKHNKIGGKPLGRSYLYTNVFSNPFYYGWFQYKDKDTGEMVWQKGEHTPMIEKWEFDRVQQFMGRTDASRPKTHHEMAFTGSLMRCASCDSSITAEPKVKRNKNGNVHHYVYYHCTKRKNPDCTERSIELKELDRQVIEILDGLEISERFKDWAIKNLHEVRKDQAETREEIFKNKHNELEAINDQLHALLLKYTAPENTAGNIISSDEYQAFKKRLLERKNALESELNDKGKELEQWLELSERTFNFARYARAWYEKGDNATRRSILACLGSNLVLKDRKIHVELHPFFSSILKNKKKLAVEESSARTYKSPYFDRQKGAFAPLRPTGLLG